MYIHSGWCTSTGLLKSCQSARADITPAYVRSPRLLATSPNGSSGTFNNGGIADIHANTIDVSVHPLACMCVRRNFDHVCRPFAAAYWSFRPSSYVACARSSIHVCIYYGQAYGRTFDYTGERVFPRPPAHAELDVRWGGWGLSKLFGFYRGGNIIDFVVGAFQ